MTERECEIGRFRLRPGRQLVAGDGSRVPIGSKALEILSALVEADGDIVTNDQLMARVWAGVAVEQNAIQVHVSALRRTLGVEGCRIVSVRGRGYRFLASAKSAVAPERTPSNLPLPATALIGRETDLAQLALLLERDRLVTVAGTGGIGKTRLALEAGHELLSRFPDGVWFVRLEHLCDPELVAGSVAGTLGVALRGARSSVEALAGFLQPKRLFLILDNAEHLMEPVAALASAILEQAAAVRMLVTSRQVLRIPGERVHRLPTLAVPVVVRGATAADAVEHSAVQLFAERAATAGAFSLTDEAAPLVAEICAKLDGIPLAIELAAARLAVLTLPELLARLQQRFRVLTAGGSGMAARQRTLRATIDWSHDLLSEKERAVFRRLALFGGSFNLAAAEQVLAAPPVESGEVLELLDALLDKSLLVADRAAAETRFRLFDSIRDYAREKLEASVETGLRRHLVAFLTGHYRSASDAYETMPTETWLSIFSPDLDNLRVALDWAFGPDGEARPGVELVSFTRAVWVELSLLVERRRWFEAAASGLDETVPAKTRARILCGLFAARSESGDPRHIDLVQEAVKLFRLEDDARGAGYALTLVGHALKHSDSVKAEVSFDEAEALLRRFGPTKSLAQLLCLRGVARAHVGQAAATTQLFEESLAVARAVGYRGWVETVELNLAEIALSNGRTDEAIDRAREAEASCRASGNVMTLAVLLHNLAGYLLARGDVTAARAAAAEALRLHLALGTSMGAALALQHLALGAALSGDVRLAARLGGYCDRYFQRERRTREYNEGRSAEALAVRLGSIMPNAEREQLMRQGADWTERQAATAVEQGFV